MPVFVHILGFLNSHPLWNSVMVSVPFQVEKQYRYL